MPDAFAGLTLLRHDDREVFRYGGSKEPVSVHIQVFVAAGQATITRARYDANGAPSTESTVLSVLRERNEIWNVIIDVDPGWIIHMDAKSDGGGVVLYQVSLS